MLKVYTCCCKQTLALNNSDHLKNIPRNHFSISSWLRDLIDPHQAQGIDEEISTRQVLFFFAHMQQDEPDIRGTGTFEPLVHSSTQLAVYSTCQMFNQQNLV